MATPTYDKYKMEGEFIEDGVLYFSPMVTKEYLDILKNYTAHHSDVILAAYPKSGIEESVGFIMHCESLCGLSIPGNSPMIRRASHCFSPKQVTIKA